MPRLRDPVARETCCAIVSAALLAALVLLFTSCGVKVQGENSTVTRIRFEDDKVTCYHHAVGISCLRDAP